MSSLSVYSGGTFYVVDRWNFASNTMQVDRTVQRAPYSTDWYAVGDGGWSPTPLVIEARIIGASLADSISDLTSLMFVAETATDLRVTIGGTAYYRDVDGLASFTKADAVMGYNVRLAFATTAPTWRTSGGTPYWL